MSDQVTIQMPGLAPFTATVLARTTMGEVYAESEGGPRWFPAHWVVSIGEEDGVNARSHSDEPGE